MAEVVGGPIDLDVCEDCPYRDRGQNLHSRIGKAKVVISERGIRGVYAPSDGRSAGMFQEHSTAIYLDNRDGYNAFTNRAHPIKDGFLQKVGLAQASCPALEEFFDGEPSDGDIIAQYLEQAEIQLTNSN